MNLLTWLNQVLTSCASSDVVGGRVFIINTLYLRHSTHTYWCDRSRTTTALNKTKCAGGRSPSGVELHPELPWRGADTGIMLVIELSTSYLHTLSSHTNTSSALTISVDIGISERHRARGDASSDNEITTHSPVAAGAWLISFDAGRVHRRRLCGRAAAVSIKGIGLNYCVSFFHIDLAFAKNEMWNAELQIQLCI